MSKPCILGAHSLAPGNGGIARVARLMARVLIEEVATAGVPIHTLLLGDRTSPKDLNLTARTTDDSKTRFVLRTLLECWYCRHFIFDGCHLAQTLSLPGLRRARMLTFIHGVEIWEQCKTGYLASARRASLLLSNSQYTLQRAEDLHGHLPRARVCWLATESDEAPPVHLGSPRPQALIVGRLDSGRYKGHRELIECWPRVVAAVPDATLCIVGQGPDEPRLRDLACRSTAAGQIRFQGFVPDAEVDQLYQQSAVFAMPSRGEGFGLVYIEAMRHGLPVIASCHDAAPEVVLDGKTGYTVNLDRAGELAEHLIQLFRDPDRAAQLGVNGRQRWAEHFRYTCFRDRFRPTLQEFLRL